MVVGLHAVINYRTGPTEYTPVSRRISQYLAWAEAPLSGNRAATQPRLIFFTHFVVIKELAMVVIYSSASSVEA